MDQDATWYGGKLYLGPGHIVFTGTQLTPRKGHSNPLLRPAPIVAKQSRSPISATAELLLSVFKRYCIKRFFRDSVTLILSYMMVIMMMIKHNYTNSYNAFAINTKTLVCKVVLYIESSKGCPRSLRARFDQLCRKYASESACVNAQAPIFVCKNNIVSFVCSAFGLFFFAVRDAAYSYRRSSVVCRSVRLSRSWALQKPLNRSRCHLGCGLGWVQGSMECTVAPPGEYDWTVSVRQRCGLMSYYFGQLLLISKLSLRAEYLRMYIVQ